MPQHSSSSAESRLWSRHVLAIVISVSSGLMTFQITSLCKPRTADVTTVPNAKMIGFLVPLYISFTTHSFGAPIPVTRKTQPSRFLMSSLNPFRECVLTVIPCISKSNMYHFNMFAQGFIAWKFLIALAIYSNIFVEWNRLLYKTSSLNWLPI